MVLPLSALGVRAVEVFRNFAACKAAASPLTGPTSPPWPGGRGGGGGGGIPVIIGGAPGIIGGAAGGAGGAAGGLAGGNGGAAGGAEKYRKNRVKNLIFVSKCKNTILFWALKPRFISKWSMMRDLDENSTNDHFPHSH